jgi:hypothetical protein
MSIDFQICIRQRFNSIYVLLFQTRHHVMHLIASGVRNLKRLHVQNLNESLVP